jgi:hypothetical protein
MKVDIDQSGKVENTAHITVLGYSNGSYGSIFIRSHDKKVIQQYFRDQGKPRLFIIQTFSILLYLLIRRFRLEENVLYLDTEYLGHEGTIVNYLSQLGIDTGRIRFTFIGKTSRAHKIAREGYMIRSADVQISAADVIGCIIRLYDKNKKRSSNR